MSATTQDSAAAPNPAPASAPAETVSAETAPADTAPATTPPAESLPRRLGRLGGQLAVFGVLVVVLQAGMGWLRGPSLPEQAPGFVLPNLDGGTVQLEDFAGRTVVLNFWATWCPPCRVEIPSFRRFAENNPDIVVLGVAVDGGLDELRKAREDLGITYPIIRADQATVAAYDVVSLPTTVIVRPDGTVRSSYAGMLFGPHLWWMTR